MNNDHHRQEPLGKDEWWIDLMEDEVEPSMSKDLSMFLLNSPADRERFRELENLKESLKASDDTYLPEDGRIYQRLHDDIMAAVDGKVPKKPLRRASPRQLNFNALIGTSLLTVLVACLAWLGAARQTSIIDAEEMARVEQVVPRSQVHVRGKMNDRIGQKVSRNDRSKSRSKNQERDERHQDRY